MNPPAPADSQTPAPLEAPAPAGPGEARPDQRQPDAPGFQNHARQDLEQPDDRAGLPAGENILLGISFKIMSTMFLTAMLVLIKLVSSRIPIGEIVFARSFFSLIPIILFAWYYRTLRRMIRPKAGKMLALRAVVGVCAMGLWFQALKILPLSDAKTIAFFAPLASVALAAILLGETVRLYRWSAVAVGFTGVLIVLVPQIEASETISTGGGIWDSTVAGSLCALLSACGIAFATILVRRLVQIEKVETITLWTALMISALALLSLPFGWVVPSPGDLALLLVIGFLGGCGQMLMALCYRYAGVSIIAPFEYISLIWAVLAGWLIFGDLPGSTVIIGSMIICSAGIFVVQRETRLGLNRRPERIADTSSRG